MNADESERAGKEARQEMAKPERGSRYGEAALRYLRETAYEPRRRRGASKPDDERGDGAAAR